MSSLFEVYSLLDVTPVKASGAYLWDETGQKYMDFYGGHAVISIGHCHPVYIERLTRQLHAIGFYSNAVHNPLQEELAEKLCALSGYTDYKLFLCNSGAEANENALKLASFATGRERVLAISGAFHGRTSAAVAVTDNPKIQSPLNKTDRVTFTPLNDIAAAQKELATGVYAAVIVEPIQGVGGIQVASAKFLQALRTACDATGTKMICDEIQSGCGRTGDYFAHCASGVRPDLITMAKGIGNGFPMAGVLIAPSIEAVKGMLGTTFGGSHLACAAALAVEQVMREEHLMQNAAAMGQQLIDALHTVKGVREVRGRGLIIGVELTVPQADFRRVLLQKHHIMTGYSGTNTLRLLPPLTITEVEVADFIAAAKATAAELC